MRNGRAIVKAKNLAVKTGDVAPMLNADSYSISGIMLPDSLGFIPEISYQTAPDTKTEGETVIVVTGPSESTDGNYKVTYENGILSVMDNPKQDAMLSEVILNFELPLAGSKDMLSAIDNITLNTSFVTIEFGQGSGALVGIFKQGTDEDLTPAVLESGLTEGEKVYLKVKITPDSGKLIDPQVTKVSINGVSLEKADILSLANGEYVQVPFTVPAYRIHFTKGIGSGSMGVQYAYSNADYVMPGSSFTPPSGMEFSCWKMEGEDSVYAAGEKIRLASSINLIAQYQEKKESPSQGGTVINPGYSGSISGGGSSQPSITTPREITKVASQQVPTFIVPSGVTYTVSKDGTAAVFTARDGKVIKKVTVNGISKGAVRSVTGLKTGDTVKVEVK